jgi:exosortase
MIPFPGFVESGLIRHLRPIATVASTNVLQTLGFFAQREGNVIVLSSTELGVAEACSGLGMLSVFVALTVAACLVVSRPLWQKFVIVLSSIPIAVLCNIVRISATGVMCEIGDADFAKNQFHDGAGWAMMPLALGLLLVELKLLDFVYELNPDEAKPARAQPVPVPG